MSGLGAASRPGPDLNGSQIEHETRAIYLPEDQAMVEVPVYSRYSLPGRIYRCDGPCVIEERESTTIVGATCRGPDRPESKHRHRIAGDAIKHGRFVYLGQPA